MIEWETHSFDDLSGVWQAAGCGDYELSVEFQAFGQYRAWVSDAAGDLACVLAESIEEAKEIAEAIYAQHVIDTHYAVFFDV